MEKNELRIGSIVWDDYSGEMIVSAIWAGQLPVCVDLKKAEHLPSGRYDLAKIEPIKLTAQRLIDWGFRNSEMNPPLFLGKGLTIYIDSDNDFMIGRTHGHGDTVGLCHLKYVHQLQNLYFALTGTELVVGAVGEKV